MARKGFTASGRKIKKTTKFSPSKSNSSRPSTPSAADVKKFAPKSKVAGAQTAAVKERSGGTAQQVKPQATAQSKLTTKDPAQQTSNPFAKTFQETKGNKPEEKGTLEKLGSNFKTGLKASLGLGEEKEQTSKFGKGLQEISNTPGVQGALFGGIDTGAIGSGFGAGGKWISAKNLKAAKIPPATSIGKLTKTGTITKTIQTNTKTTGIFKKIFAKIFTSEEIISAVNPQTGKVVTTILTKTSVAKPALILSVIGGMIATSAWIAEKSLGGAVFGGWQTQEAAAPLAAAGRTALQAGDLESYQEITDLQMDMLNRIEENLENEVPYTNSKEGVQNFVDLTRAAIEVQLRVTTDQAANPEETYEEVNSRIRANEQLDEIALRDDYERRRKAMLAFEEEADDRDMKEDAKFWADERDAERKREEEDRIAQAEFWQAYRKQIQQAQQDSRPSNLKFGLL